MKDASLPARSQLALGSQKQINRTVESDLGVTTGPTRASAKLINDLCDSISAKLKPLGIELAHARLGVDPRINFPEVRRQLEWLGFLDESNEKDSPVPENLPIVE